MTIVTSDCQPKITQMSFPSV